MPKMVIVHEVVEIERWLKGKEARAAAIGAHATNVVDHVALDGSNRIAITADVHDPEGMRAMLASPPADVAANMEAHGVIPPLTVYIER